MIIRFPETGSVDVFGVHRGAAGGVGIVREFGVVEGCERTDGISIHADGEVLVEETFTLVEVIVPLLLRWDSCDCLGRRNER